MTDRIRVYAGACTAEFEGSVDRTARGHGMALVKPDNTVLVHDRGGYSPAAWLTRAASIDVDHEKQITAIDGDQRLTVRFHDLEESGVYPIGVAGVPVGPSEDANEPGPYVRSRDSVVNITTGDQYALPSGRGVLNRSCPCGLPLIRADRETKSDRSQCLDPECEQG